MNSIEIRSLKKSFGKTIALNGINLDIPHGEIFGFLGPNGAGKTTTIRCLMNFLDPDDGQIKILGMDSKNDSVEIKKQVGYLTGDVRLYDGWTGNDHIKFLEGIRGVCSNAPSLAQKLNFNPKLKFKALSSGNKQKLGLILALMFNPKLIVLDEPTLGLDPLLQNAVYEILEDLKKQGTTVFMSSHNLAEVDRVCSRVAVIKDGQIIATESIQGLKDKKMHTATARFEGPFNQYDFNFDNVEVEEQLQDGLLLNIKGDINPLVKKLANYQVKELEIKHASLDEIFLEFYGSSANRGQIPSLPTISPEPTIAPKTSGLQFPSSAQDKIPPSVQTENQSEQNIQKQDDLNQIPKLE